MPKVFITRPIPEAGPKLLEEKGYEVVVNMEAIDRPATKEEILNAFRQAQNEGRPFDALLAVLTEQIDAEIMEAGLPTLKIIANYAVGVDNINVLAAKERNILVANTPEVLTNTVAEHAFALMLSLARRISEADRFSRAGKYKAWGPQLLLGVDLFGKTLGIVGLGRIGSRVAYHATKGFEMKVLYFDINRNEEFEKELAAQYMASVDELLPQCDFVSIHVPLLDSTRHLINEVSLKKMKPTAYLINTSRGAIIDEKALTQALVQKTIAGAALDVFEFEPVITPELKNLDNVILTPHIASATKETRQKMSILAAQNIIEALEGHVPPNLIK